jgi:hypothetical protein
MLQSSLSTVSSGLKFEAIAIEIKIQIKKLLNFRSGGSVVD